MTRELLVVAGSTTIDCPLNPSIVVLVAFLLLELLQTAPITVSPEGEALNDSETVLSEVVLATGRPFEKVGLLLLARLSRS